MIINKAILHILDFNSNVTVFSQQLLDVRNSVETYLLKHLEKAYIDPGGKTGKFLAGSQFQSAVLAYRDGGTDFIALTAKLAEIMQAELARSDAPDSADLLFCDLSTDTERLLALLKFDNKVGFTHQVISGEEGLSTQIINHYAILPGMTQKVDEYAFVDLSTLAIRYADKKRQVDGQDAYLLAELVLECSSRKSAKETVSLVKDITRQVAEKHGRNSVAAVARAKHVLRDNSETSDYLNPAELGREVFGDSQLMQDEYLAEVAKAGLDDAVKVDKEYAKRAVKNHKLKTDTGIEITVPVDYFQNNDYIEFINNPDGTLSIQLKNIGKLTNK